MTAVVQYKDQLDKGGYPEGTVVRPVTDEFGYVYATFSPMIQDVLAQLIREAVREELLSLGNQTSLDKQGTEGTRQ